VMAGEFVTSEAERQGIEIVPIDSEHSALWQCLRGEEKGSIDQLILTASGGPFRDIPLEELPDHGCWENLTEALKPWNIPPYDIPSPFNLFQTVTIDPRTGLMLNTTIRPKPGTYMDLRAEMHCLVAISSCPDLWAGGTQGLNVQVYE